MCHHLLFLFNEILLLLRLLIMFPSTNHCNSGCREMIYETGENWKRALPGYRFIFGEKTKKQNIYLKDTRRDFSCTFQCSLMKAQSLKRSICIASWDCVIECEFSEEACLEKEKEMNFKIWDKTLKSKKNTLMFFFS